MEKICLDTDMVVECLLNKEDAVAVLAKIEKTADIAITPFTLFELFCIAEKGEKPEEQKKIVEELAQHLTLLPVTPEVCAKAAQLFKEGEKKGRNLEMQNLFVGLMAAEKKYAMLTKKPEAYQEIPEVRIYNKT